MSRPDNLRNDPGYWLCLPIVVLFLPIIIPIAFIMEMMPKQRRERKARKECKERGHHLWGEYQNHPYWDIPHQFCTHCPTFNPDSYAPPSLSRVTGKQP